MPPARTLPVVQHSTDLHTAAVAQERIRIQGVITDVGEERNHGYRTVWLQIATVDRTVHITASPTSRLGRAQPGAVVDVAVLMTGMPDLPANTYLGRNAQLIDVE